MIKVFLQFPWKTSDSQYYRNLMDYPPEGVKYIANISNAGMITNKRKLAFLNFIKRKLRAMIKKLNLSVPNAHKTTSSEKYDLIHCAHCLSSNDSPWVADFESFWQMWVYPKDTVQGKKKILKILKKENCKKIIAWTEEAKKEIQKKFPEIKNKVEIVSHALPKPSFKKVKSKYIRLLFVGRYFERKGGIHVVEAFDRVTKKFPNVKAKVISTTPEFIIEKYSKNKNIEFTDLMPYEKILNEIYPQTDILVYPGYSDTFGFIFTEALSYGIPIVTVDGFARKELVEDGKTGFVIPKKNKIDNNSIGKNEEKIIQEMIKKIVIFVEDKKLREKMSKECLDVVEKGKFSIKKRNEKLKKIYEEALNEK